MNAPHKFPEATPATREHQLRILVERLLEGDFSQVSLNLYDELKWTDTARWFADVAGELIDEQQVFAEIELMLRKSAWQRDYNRLSERDQEASFAGDLENYFAERERSWTALVAPPADIADTRVFPNFARARADLAAMPAAERDRLNQEWAA